MIEGKYILKEHQTAIYCNQKCYMAELWQYKINDNNYFNKYQFLHDHPFPNSFYAKDFHQFFHNSQESDFDWISTEAVIVSIADEIAQRQQDLEDGIQKKLFSLKDAKKQVRQLIEPFTPKYELTRKNKEVEEVKNQEELGNVLVKFYVNLLVKTTRKNLLAFGNNNDKRDINIYCFFRNVFELDEYKKFQHLWINAELSCFSYYEKNNNIVEPYFTLNYDKRYLCFAVYYYLEESSKKGTDVDYNTLNNFIEYLINTYPNVFSDVFESFGHCNDQLQFLNNLEKIENVLKRNKLFKDVYEDAIAKQSEKKYWKNIEHLNMKQFYYFEKFIQENGLYLETHAAEFNFKNIVFPDASLDKYPDEFAVIFHRWKSLLGSGANQVLSHLVSFVSDDDPVRKDKQTKIDEFEKIQKLTILHSESVEKNDGKASYILKRLFKAFMANSHQLTDKCLRMILINLIDNYEDYKFAEKKRFDEIVQKLSKTLPENDNYELVSKAKCLDFSLIAKKDHEEENKYNELYSNMSNEIKALLDKRKELYETLVDIINIEQNINNDLKSELLNENLELKKCLRLFRGILDNPVFNATAYWKSILIRGICDYIASLTDQEAIDEYEKLYAGIMEIV